MRRLGSAGVVSVVAVLFSCGPAAQAPSEDDGFEAFVASTRQLSDGTYLVEGDLPVLDLEELRDYYLSHRAPPPADGVKRDDLTLHQYRVPQRVCTQVRACDPNFTNCGWRTVCACANVFVCSSLTPPSGCGWQVVCPTNGLSAPIDSVWNSGDVQNLSYCVSNNLGGSQASITAATRDAALAWERAAAVRFVHRADLDGAGCEGNTQVTFDVRQVAAASDDGSFSARAFFPNWQRSSRHVEIAQNLLPVSLSSQVAVMTHELGHVLGFEHEQARFTQTNATCLNSISPDWRGLTTPDGLSIMQYAVCAGALPGVGSQVTRRDAKGARRLYGAPPRSRLVALRNLSSCVVSAAAGGGSSLTSAGTTIGPNETFELIELTAPDAAGQYLFTLRARDGRYVGANANGTVTADRFNPDSSTTFQADDRTWLTATSQFGTMLSANCTTGVRLDTLGLLELIPLDERPAALRTQNGRYTLFRFGNDITIGLPVTSIFMSDVMSVVELGNNKVAFRCADGTYGSLSGTSFLCASTVLGTQETLTRTRLSSGWHLETYRAPNGLWLEGFGSTLSATASSNTVASAQLALVDLRGERVSLQASGGQFVQALNGGEAEVRAVGGAAGAFETFSLVQLSATEVALRSDDGLYVTTEASTTNRLVARADWVDTWERYTAQWSGTDRLCLRSVANGQWVTAENSGGQELIANRAQCAQWETFQVRR